MRITPKEGELIFILAFLAVVLGFYAVSIKDEIEEGVVIEQKIYEYQESIKPFLNLALNAESFAIYDMDKKDFVYKNNAEISMPLASLSKIMSAIVIMENVPADYVFKISKEALSESGDNKLLFDEKWGRDELLKFSLVESSNDALYQMAYDTGLIIDPASTDPIATFVATMNGKAKELNRPSLKFHNPSGLDVTPEMNGGYGNARDIARLFSYAIETYPDIFAPTRFAAPVFMSEDAEHVAKNTNPFVSELPGLIASKTGFTNLSGGNLVVALNGQKGERLVVVVMGSTFDDRFTDVKMISEKVIIPTP